MQHNPLFAAFAGQPAMVAEEMQASFEASLHAAEASYAAYKIRDQAEGPAQMVDDFWFAETDWRSYYRPYVVVDGILQIPVKGVLLADFPFAIGSYATGYEYIWRAYERGMDDDNVKGIALVANSPGGVVAKNFDLVDKMYARRGEKPVRSFASEHAYSAAYSIASVADSITVARTGGVGSIGVVAMHVEFSEMLKTDGIKVTFIKKGAHKTDGNSYEPLTAAVLARLEAKMEVPYSLFVATVARNRGLDEQAVRDTEAATFTPDEALSNGLADAVGSLDDALATFVADLSQDDGEDQMSNADNTAVDQAAIDAAHLRGVTEGTAAGTTVGVTAERTRIVTILACDEAKDRPKAALAAALKSDMTAEQAAAFLADLPKEAAEAAAPGKTFEDAMNQGDNPDVGSGGGNEAADKESGAADVALARQYGLAGLKDAPAK